MVKNKHMRLLSVLLLILSLSGCFSAPTRNTEKDVELRDIEVNARANGDAPRNRVMVLPFLDERPDRSKKIAEASRQVMVRELLRTGHFIVVAMEDFPQDPKKFITAEQEYDLAAIARIAANMGISAVIEGKVLEVRIKNAGDSVGLIRKQRAEVESKTRIRVFAGKNAKEILNETRSAIEEATATHLGERDTPLGEDPELVKQSVRKALMGGIPNLVKSVEKLNWEGRIAMVAGEKIYVNAGRLSGLQVGDILKITEDGDDVYDPENGKYLGTAPGRMKGTVEVVSYFGKDGCVTVIHSGSGFQENDRVELY